jgi:hypothetical protein
LSYDLHFREVFDFQSVYAGEVAERLVSEACERHEAYRDSLSWVCGV